MSKRTGIYKIENLENGKAYIGQAVNIKRRWNAHKSNLNKNEHHNIHLQREWNKYGEKSFSFSILIECNKDDLDSLEIYYIDKYNSFKDGYNRDTGGKIGRRFSEESKKRMSESKTNLTEEEKKKRFDKFSLAHQYESIKIIQIDLTGKIIKEWKSARYCSKILKIDQSCIYNCLVHKRKTYKGFIWIYKYEYKNFKLNDYINKTAPKIIIQADANNNVINVFNGTSSVKKELGFDSSYVAKCCKFKGNNSKYKNKSHGFLWYYINDYMKINKNFDIIDFNIIDHSSRDLKHVNEVKF